MAENVALVFWAYFGDPYSNILNMRTPASTSWALKSCCKLYKN